MTISAAAAAALRSQEEVQKRFGPLLRSEAAVFRKAQTAFIRPAVKGERISTVIDGAHETTNTVKGDDFYVACGKTAGEMYILSGDDFRASYEPTSRRPIEPTTAQAKKLAAEGFYEYQSKRSVYAHEVDSSDIAWLRHRNDSANNNGEEKDDEQTRTAYFMASWGESMRVECGDLLVMQYPGGNDEVYRVEKNVFGLSYRPMM